MNLLFQAAVEVQTFFQSHRWRFCFIGGMAVLRWGEPRMTQDIDLSLFVGFGDEAPYIRALLDQFEARIPKAADFALRNRVVLVRTRSGVPVDIALAGLPFEEQVVARASDHTYAPGCQLLTCSAEDLLVFKAFAARAKDWVDVEGIVVRQGGKLDTAYVLEQLTPLAAAKEAPEIMLKLQALLKLTP